MKKLLITGIICLLTLGAYAQSDDDIALVQSLYGKEKRTIVADYMKLTPAEETGFWKEYEVYETARKELGKEKIMLLNDYIENFESLTDEKAAEITNKAIANNIALQKLSLKTFNSMSKVISPVKAAQFIQMENYFSLSVQMSVQDAIPFIGEMEKMLDK